MHEFYYTAVYWSYVLVLVSGHQESEIRPRVQGPGSRVQGPDKNYTRGRIKLQREMTRPRPHQCRCQCQLKHIDLMD